MVRKAFLLAGVFALCFAGSATLTKVEAAACRYRCICGTPYKCCTNNGVETCKVATGTISCPQSFPC